MTMTSRMIGRSAMLATVAAATLCAAGLLAVVGGLGTAVGQGSHSGHGSHSGEAQPRAAATPSTRAFEEINERMHKDMAIRFTGDADIDFVRGMIPHHQGAVEMAEVVLKHGKDAEVRKLAEEVIKAQKSEIAWMQAWLEKNAKGR